MTERATREPWSVQRSKPFPAKDPSGTFVEKHAREIKSREGRGGGKREKRKKVKMRRQEIIKIKTMKRE